MSSELKAHLSYSLQLWHEDCSVFLCRQHKGELIGHLKDGFEGIGRRESFEAWAISWPFASRDSRNQEMQLFFFNRANKIRGTN